VKPHNGLRIVYSKIPQIGLLKFISNGVREVRKGGEASGGRISHSRKPRTLYLIL
jgi:hypothetical protein